MMVNTGSHVVCQLGDRCIILFPAYTRARVRACVYMCVCVRAIMETCNEGTALIKGDNTRVLMLVCVLNS